MKGFFELEKPIKLKTQSKNKTLDCETCGLYKQVRSPRMPMTGRGKLGVIILGEAPGRHEDEQNKQFVGDAGDVLREAITENGYQLERDFYKQNVVRCRPTSPEGSNRTPTKQELQCCRAKWWADVESIKPKFIWLMGAKAVESFYANRSQPITTDLSIGRWNRTCVPDPETGAWVISLYHPSFAVRTPDFKVRFKKDIQWAFEQLKRTAPEFPDWKSKVDLITKYNVLIDYFDTILTRKQPTIIDFETSGLRPYKSGHHIWSASMYLLYEQIAFSFPYSYPNHWNEKQFKMIETVMKQILSDPEITKIAQSIQMEDSWSRRVIGVEPKGWIHDTMVCSHLINEHRKFTGLDFQVFINWGYEYGEEITPFKTANGNGFNRMHEAPLMKLLEYNGLDSLFTGMLFERQVKILEP